jgi:hypothetical protein
MPIGPVPAMHKALGRAGWRLEEVGLLEVNEAFAAPSVAVVDELKADPALVNVNGRRDRHRPPAGLLRSPDRHHLAARDAPPGHRSRHRHVGTLNRFYAARCGIVPVALRAGGRLGSGCVVILGPAVPRWRQ